MQICTFSQQLIMTLTTKVNQSRWVHVGVSYITVWVQKTPSTLIKEAFWVIIDGLHDLGPVQTLNTLCVLDVT